jgi:hypothetical protein
VAESIDLGSMSFDQLVDLRDQITREISTRPEWKDVYVPAGFYEIGVDIPAGRWTLVPALTEYFEFSYGNVANDTMTDVSYSSDNYVSETIAPRDSIYFSIAGLDNYSLVMEEGYYLVIEGDCKIRTYIRPALDF